MIEDYSPKKIENKKKDQNYYQTSKENCKKYCKSIIEIFLKPKKLKKDFMLTLEIKVSQMQTEK